MTLQEVIWPVLALAGLLGSAILASSSFSCASLHHCSIQCWEKTMIVFQCLFFKSQEH